MTEVWALPGYDVQALIGYGATGEVWRARDLATGDAVALKRLRDGADVTAVERLRQEASLLCTLDTPYVVRLRALLGEGADTVLVLDLAVGGSLSALLARRGSLDPGEIVTIAAPIAQALAAAHACGLVHGDVTPSNILFTSAGMPLLADLGLARLAGERRSGVHGAADYVDPAVAAGGRPDAASDVWGLAAVCRHLLSGTTPQPLVAAIEQALQADPSLRPDAAGFAAALERSHAAAPVRLTGAAAAPALDARVTHAIHGAAVAGEVAPSRDRRRLLLAAGAVGVLALAAAVGWLSGRSGPVDDSAVATPATLSASPDAATGPATEPDWRAILARLDARRATSFARADATLLLDVYAPGSALIAADRSSLARLHAAGHTARGVRHTIRSVTTSSYDGRSATVRLVDVMAAYDVVDASGNVVQRAGPRAAAAFVVTLLRTPRGWLLQQVVPA